MKTLQTYRLEHAALMNQMRRIHDNLELARWKQGQTQVQQFLAAVVALKDEVLAHAYYEERDFYPWIRTLKNEQVVAHVEQLRDDFFPIERAFDAFLTIWSPAQILQYLNEFDASLLELTDLLKNRIDAEERIFTLLDELGLEP